MRVCPAGNGKGACACANGQVSNIRLRPSPQVDIRATGVPGTGAKGAASAAPTSFEALPPASLLEGVDTAICQFLGIRHLGHKSALLELCKRDTFPAGSVDAAYSQIASNWRRCHEAGAGSPSPRIGVGASRNWPFPPIILARRSGWNAHWSQLASGWGVPIGQIRCR